MRNLAACRQTDVLNGDSGHPMKLRAQMFDDAEYVVAMCCKVGIWCILIFGKNLIVNHLIKQLNVLDIYIT